MHRALAVIDPVITIALAVLVALYLTGLWRMRRKGDRRHAGGWLWIWFFGAIAVTALAVLSPLDTLGSRFFSAHMAQHLLLIVVAAPLFAISDAPAVLGVLVSAGTRRRLAIPAIVNWMNGAEATWAAAAAFVLVVWFWHVPAAHDWALASEPAHAAEHLTVLVAATLFWRAIIAGSYRRSNPGMAALLMSLVGLGGALLSALIMFAPTQLCRAYAGNPIGDQVLAGLLMCIPASFVYLASTVWALWCMLEGDTGRRPNAGG